MGWWSRNKKQEKDKELYNGWYEWNATVAKSGGNGQVEGISQWKYTEREDEV